MEKQEAIVDAEQVKKPRKRFVGRAKKTASTANNEAGGAIEDGAVGFASKVFNMPTLNKLLILTPHLIEAPRARSSRVANQVPDEILNDPLLNKSLETVSMHKIRNHATIINHWWQQMPSNYNFEIHKTVWRVRKAKAKRGK